MIYHLQIYWRAWRSFISCTALTFHIPAVFSLLFRQCWQIIYFGLLSRPIFQSSKGREATVLCSSLNVYIICIQPLSCQPCTAESLPYNSTRGCRPTTGWRDTAPEVYSKGLSTISTVTLLPWLCRQQQQVQLHQNKLEESYKSNTIALYMCSQDFWTSRNHRYCLTKAAGWCVTSVKNVVGYC